MLGLGTVGSAVAERLRDEAGLIMRRAGVRIELVRVVVRDADRPRTVGVEPEIVSTDASALLGDESLGVVVELIGGLEPAHGHIEQVLRSGRSVVTANKAVIAMHGAELVRLGGARLRFEAAVGGGIPVIGTLVNALAAQRVTGIAAVINGTANFILDAMAAGGDHAAAVAEARRLGFAEEDPSADVDGSDAACKLAIMASLALDRWIHPDTIRRTGIAGLRPGDFRAAWLCGHSIRLLASARLDGAAPSACVEPTALRRAPSPHTDRRVTPGHPLADVRGPENGVLFTADMAGPLLLRGAGAGGEATAGAVIADIIALARDIATGAGGHRAAPPMPNAAAPAAATTPGAADDRETGALIIVEAQSRDEDLRVVRQLLDDRGVTTISMAYDTDDPVTLRVGLLTKPAAREAIAAAIATLDADPRFEDGVRWLPALP